MPLTSTQQAQINRLFVGMFGAAPGVAYMNACADYVAGGGTVAGIASILASSSTFTSSQFYPSGYTSTQFAEKLVTNLLSGSSSAAQAAAKTWIESQDGTLSRGEIIRQAVEAISTVATSDADWGASAAQLTNRVTVADYYFTNGGTATDVATLQNVVSSVTSSESTVTTAQAAISAGTIGGATSTALVLTGGADVINGSNGNDNITGAIGTLSTVDEVHGNGGTDSLTVVFAPTLATAGSGVTASPLIDGVETITLTNRAASGTFDFSNVSGVQTINVQANQDTRLTNMVNTAVNVNGVSATFTVDLATATASTAAYGVTLNLSGSTAMNLVWGDDSGSTALVDTLTLNAQTTWGNAGSATTFAGVEKLVLQGNGNVSLNMVSANAGGMSADGFADLTANNTAAGIDASGLSGALTLSLDSGDVNVKGGAGADTFNMTANFNTNDTLDGGAGADVLNATLTGGYLRPIVNAVETFNLVTSNTALTADFRDVTGATVLNMLQGSGVLLDKLTTSLSTINVNSSDSTANALTVQFGSAAVASDVTLNLGNGVQGNQQTAAATASGLGIGTITMSGNSGGLTIITNSTAKYSAAAVEIKDFTAVTVNAASANFVVDSALDVNTAQTLTLMAAAGMTLSVGNDLSANVVNNFTISAGQSATITLSETAQVQGSTGGTVTLGAAASAVIDFSAVAFCGQTAMSVTVGDGGLVTANAITLGEVGATAGSGAVAMSTIDISAVGDVSIASMVGVSASTAINLTINVGLANSGTAADVGISGFVIMDVAGAATANEQNVNINVSGTGQFKFSAGAIASSNVSYHVNATALASGSMFTINLAGVNDTDSVASAVFGAASGIYVGVDGVDNIEVGVGAVTVNGGLGNDVITLGTTAVTRVEFSANATGLAGLDTIIGAGAGDVLLFNGSTTATGATALNSGVLRTGTATNTADIGTASYTALGSAVANSAANWANIYTSNGDTIIEVWNTTAGTATGFLAGTADADFVRVTLSNKDFTAITAAFQLNTTGSGLSITLL